MAILRKSASKTDLVRYSHDGHDFHFTWSARQALKLLDPRSGLVAVSIEGVSPSEKTSRGSSRSGELVIDTAEYYGSQSLDSAKLVVYNQLKYSTVAAKQDFTAAMFAPAGDGSRGATFQGFAQKYLSLAKRFGAKAVEKRFRFRLVTNRPIAATLRRAIELGRANGSTLKESSDTKRDLHRLQKATNLDPNGLRSFLRTVDLHGKQDSADDQRLLLFGDVGKLVSASELDASIKLKALVQQKALSSSSANPIITRESVLHSLGVSDSAKLLPSEPNFEAIRSVIQRKQVATIAKQIIDASTPVVVHAAGGIGKSVLATLLPSFMPRGSEAVVFDGFAGGNYRSPRDPRHQHERGLLQIGNEFSIRGLCLPLLPSERSPADYLSTFWRRISEVAESVTSRSRTGLVLVVLDAADNSEMAAREMGRRSFARDLLQERVLPNRVRLVGVARTERLTLLDLAPEVARIKLTGFSLEESAQLLRSRFPDASDADAKEFHRLTAANPRVQANELDANHGSVADLLRVLSPGISSIEEVIEAQIRRSLDRVKQQFSSDEQRQILCTGLAMLPPRVPISVLAQATNVDPSTVSSFVSDIGRPLLELDGAVQFRDEPVETWFRRTFTDNKHVLSLISNLSAGARSNAYVASAMPRLLHSAGQYDKLVEDGLKDLDVDFPDPVARREVALQRSQFALRSAVRKGDSLAVAKLLLRIGEQVSTKNRQADFVVKNADLISDLFGPGQVQELVMRREAGEWFGSMHAHTAALLAPNEIFRGEARSFLRLAYDWLNEWARMPDEERKKSTVKDEDVAAIVMARLFLSDTKGAVHEITRWRPPNLHWRIGLIVINKLLDIHRDDLAARLARDSAGKPLLSAATVVALEAAGIAADKKILDGLAKELLKRGSIFRRREYLTETADVPVAVAEALCRTKQGKRTAKTIIEAYLRPIPERISSSNARSILRIRALKAALEGIEFVESHVIPKSLRKLIDGGSNEHSDVTEFRELVGPLMPMYGLRAQVIVGRILGQPVRQRIETVRTAVATNAWRYARNWRSVEVLPTFCNLWLEIECRAGLGGSDTVTSIETWLEEHEVSLGIPTWTGLTKAAASYPGTRQSAILFARHARELTLESHLAASTSADSYAQLARAILRVNRAEAVAYLSSALEVLDRLDDEAMSRFDAVLRLAERAEPKDSGNPEIAYGFARVAEVVGKEFYDSSKFPWGRVIRSVTRIAPSSALAISSRWRDRSVVGADEIVLSVLMELLAQRLISPVTSAALRVTSGTVPNTGFNDFAEKVLSVAGNSTSLGKVFNFLVEDVEFDEGSSYHFERLLNLGKKAGINDEWIVRANHIVRMRAKEKAEAQTPTKKLRATMLPMRMRTSKRPKLNWVSVFRGLNVCEPADIALATRRYASTEPPLNFESLYARMRARVSSGAEAIHLKALSESQELELWQVIAALKEGRAAWKNLASVQQSLQGIVKGLVIVRATDVMKSWYGVSSLISDLCDVGGFSRQFLVAEVTKHSADRLQAVSAESIFALAGEYAIEIKADVALDALQYGLDRFGGILKAKDGDGVWDSTLAPIASVHAAIASFLWAMLAAPEADTRWRGVHAIRRLFVAGEKAVIDQLLKLYDSTSGGAFVDRSLPFYHFNAKLYLLIALARSADIAPNLLKSHLPALQKIALEGIPHVLIRNFAAIAIQNVARSLPGSVPASVLDSLRKVNRSAFAEIPESKEDRYRAVRPGPRESRFSFAYDMDRYWFEPLASIFGKSQHDAMKQAEKWVVDEWKSTLESWKSDPRHRRQIYRERETWASHSSHPRSEDFRFYLSYHALMCVAGEFVKKYPVVLDYSGSNRWGRWLQDRGLTRQDGRWLFDRRDPIPLDLVGQAVVDGNSDEDWQEHLRARDFDAQLETLNGKGVVLWGWWKVPVGSRQQTISIRSALVRPKYSLALVRAMQFSTEPYGYGLPSSRSHQRDGIDGFHLTPWVDCPEMGYGLDEFDPLGGRISYPIERPNRTLQKAGGLTSNDHELRAWKCTTSASRPVLCSEVWGDWRDRDRHQVGQFGHRLYTKVSTMQALLTKLDRDLVVEVSVERNIKRPGQNEATYAHPRWRTYLFTRSGRVKTIQGRPWLRPTHLKSAEEKEGPQRSRHRMGRSLRRGTTSA